VELVRRGRQQPIVVPASDGETIFLLPSDFASILHIRG
jgi:hypothetical protein